MRGVGRQRGQLLFLVALILCVIAPAHAAAATVSQQASTGAAARDGTIHAVDFVAERPTAPTPPKWIPLAAFATASAAVAAALLRIVERRRTARFVPNAVPVSWHRRGPPLPAAF